jgi:hypothetical protein
MKEQEIAPGIKYEFGQGEARTLSERMTSGTESGSCQIGRQMQEMVIIAGKIRNREGQRQ